MSSQRGFTLIEALVVILVVGIIAAIAMPALVGDHRSWSERANEACSEHRGVARPLDNDEVICRDGEAVELR